MNMSNSHQQIDNIDKNTIRPILKKLRSIHKDCKVNSQKLNILEEEYKSHSIIKNDIHLNTNHTPKHTNNTHHPTKQKQNIHHQARLMTLALLARCSDQLS